MGADKVKTFGDSSNFYSAKRILFGKIEASHSEKLLSNAINYHQPELKKHVERSVKKWNQLIRENLRNETGLRFQVGDDKDYVTAKLADGFPLPIKNIINQERDPELWEFKFNRKLLEQTKDGLELVGKNYKRLADIIKPSPEITDIEGMRRYIESVLRLIESKELDEKIKNIQQDVLGAYFFRIPVILIYWQVIGFIALRFNLSIDALTAIVLTHELAHAFTHLGKDIDKIKWDTESFAKTDLFIIEGLAQFYTDTVCEKLKDRYPQLSETYNVLLEHQSEPYLAHKKWIENRKRIGEVIRLGLIQIRIDDTRNIYGFNKNLENIREQVLRKEKNQEELFRG